MRKTKLEKTFQSEFSKSVKNHFNNLDINYFFNKQHIAVELIEIFPKSKIKNYFDKLGVVGVPYYYKKIKDLGDQNPYDCFVRFNKQHIAFELKMNASVKTFNFKQMFHKREHELYYLALEELMGFKAYVIINHYLRTPKHKINTIFCLSVKQAIWFHAKGSVSLEKIEKNAIKLNKVKGFIDLTQIIY